MSNLDDPRVLFAAERTLLAWQRTAISLMAFGFVVERFGLFVRIIGQGRVDPELHLFSLVMGVVLIVLGAGSALVSTFQYRAVIRTLRPEEFPGGYCSGVGLWLNYLIAAIGLAMAVHFVWDALRA